MRIRHPGARRLVTVATVAVAGLTIAAPPASAATGPGASAYVATRIGDPNGDLPRVGNAYDVSVGVDVNPEGIQVSGTVASYDCAPGQTVGCDRVALHRLVPAGPASVNVANDGSAQITATVAEVRARDGRQLRVWDVDVALTPGTLTVRQNCTCSFSDSNGNTYTQRKWVRQWDGSTASGTIGPFNVVAGPASTGSSSKYQVKSSVLQP